MTLKNDEKFEEELTICFKIHIRNLKNFRDGSRDFENGGRVLYIGHHGFPKKRILGFRPSKKAKTTSGTISFWQNISISIFKFSPFLYTMKACQWNLINFSKFANALIRKEKKHLCSIQWEKKHWEKLDFFLKLFYEDLWYDN